MDLLLDTTGTNAGNHDVFLRNGDLAITGSITEETEQALRQALNLFYGEYFLDTDRGIPYIQTISEGRFDPELVQSIFLTTILEVPGVLEVVSLSLLLETTTRELFVNLTVRTQEGILLFNEGVGV